MIFSSILIAGCRTRMYRFGYAARRWGNGFCLRSSLRAAASLNSLCNPTAGTRSSTLAKSREDRPKTTRYARSRRDGKHRVSSHAEKVLSVLLEQLNHKGRIRRRPAVHADTVARWSARQDGTPRAISGAGALISTMRRRCFRL